MLVKRLINLKKILVPFLLMFGLTGFAGENFAAKSSHDRVSAKTVKDNKHKKTKKKPAKAKKAAKAKVKKAHKSSKKSKKSSHDMKTSHKGTKKPKHSKKHVNESRKTHEQGHDAIDGHRDDGRPIYRGPRGGRYYINDSGNKVYIQR